MEDDEFESISSFEEAIWNPSALAQSGVWPLQLSVGDEERGSTDDIVDVVDNHRQGVATLPVPARDSRLAGRVAPPTRLRSAAYFLTYSQTGYSKEHVHSFLVSKGAVKRMICAEEHHQDGNKHVHALVEYERAKDVRPNFFDIGAEHPNIGIWTNRSQTYDSWFVNHWDYCTKEDLSPILIGTRPSVERKRKREEVFQAAMQLAINESVDSGMQYLCEHQPYDALTKYAQIAAAMHMIRAKKHCVVRPARPLSDFKNVPPLPTDWKNLFFQGDTNLGKTQYARALLPGATLVRHADQLRYCDFSKGVIFDDFACTHWPPASVIHLLDWDEPSGINVKHGHVIIPAGTKKIFTFNSELTYWAPRDATNAQMDAIRRRIDVIQFTLPLY